MAEERLERINEDSAGLGGLGIVFGIELYIVRSFTTGEHIERKLGIPHIASIPEMDAAG